MITRKALKRCLEKTLETLRNSDESSAHTVEEHIRTVFQGMEGKATEETLEILTIETGNLIGWARAVRRRLLTFGRDGTCEARRVARGKRA